MDFKKVAQKHLVQAQKLVEQLTKAQGANQMALKRNREEYDALIREGHNLANRIAEASEYLDDLQEAATD